MTRKFIVTRDKTNREEWKDLDDCICLWKSDYNPVKDGNGEFYCSKVGVGIVVEVEEFKELFGFTPRKGSKVMYELQIGEVKR